MSRALAISSALAATLVIVAAVPTKGEPNFSDLAFRPHPGAELPLGTKFVDENGRTVTLGRFFDKTPVILVLDYLRCRALCGATMENIVGALDQLPFQAARDFQFVAISIDPRDTPADAKAARAKYVYLYARAGHIGFHFLTSPSGAAPKIAETVGFPYRYDASLDEYIHPAGFVIASPEGRVSRYMEGIAVAPKDLTAALAGAEANTSEGPLTRILLFCHIQGTPLGRFTLPVLTTMMLVDIAAGFALTVLFSRIIKRPRR